MTTGRAGFLKIAGLFIWKSILVYFPFPRGGAGAGPGAGFGLHIREGGLGKQVGKIQVIRAITAVYIKAAKDISEKTNNHALLPVKSKLPHSNSAGCRR